MAYKVKFFTFSKKSNSTKIPASNVGVEFDCIIKTESGILHPTVELQQAATYHPSSNYCYIASFGRYYWVREWRFTTGLWIADLTVDVLGSYKTDIGNASLYILRSAAAYGNYIIDTHYPLQSNFTQDVLTPTNLDPWWTIANSLSSGRYVVGVRGLVKSGQAAGTTTYLILSPSEFKTFTQRVFDSQMTDFVTGTPLDIGDTLAKMIFDPTKYVASCIWLPGTPTGTSQTTGINVGWWSFSGTYSIVSPATYLAFSKWVQIPNHPQSAQRGVYLNVPPFTQRLIHLPRVGLIDISDKIPPQAGGLLVILEVDPISGEGVYKLYWAGNILDTTTFLFDEIQVQIGVEIPLTSTLLTMKDFASSLGSVGNTAINLLSGNILGAAGDIASSLSSFSPHLQDIGKHSGFLGYTNDPAYPFVLCKYGIPVNADITENGRPLCQVRQISTLPGYNKVLHGDIEISGATSTELDQIREFLEGGFYYE